MKRRIRTLREGEGGEPRIEGIEKNVYAGI